MGARWQWVNGTGGDESDGNRQFLQIFCFFFQKISLAGKRKNEEQAEW